MPKFVVVIGTRPEACQMAPVILAPRAVVPDEEALVCNTGQHREMLAQTLQAFQITPDIDLGLMQPDQSLSGL